MENRSIEALRSIIRALVVQEVRILRTKQACSSSFVLSEMKQSIHDTKKRVADLVGRMDSSRRNRLIKKIVDQSVEEEIEQAIERRKDKCLRCVNIRYFDETGTGHVHVPSGSHAPAVTIGCEHPSLPGTSCVGFIEKLDAVPIEEYITEVALLYEVKEMFDEIEEIWDEYLNK